MKLYRYVDHQRLHIVTKDVISLSISVLLLFRHYISHKITFGAPSSGGVLRSACGAFIFLYNLYILNSGVSHHQILPASSDICWPVQSIELLPEYKAAYRLLILLLYNFYITSKQINRKKSNSFLY